MASYILVVDDDPAILAALASFLTLRRLPFKTASDGPEALALVCDECPTLILLDFHLPGLNGAEVLSALNARGCAVPTVLMSASTRDITEQAKELGCIAYLPKPFALKEIDTLVQRWAA